MAGCLESKRPVGEPRSRWEVAVGRDAVGGNKEERRMEAEDREGYGPKTGRSAIE